MKNEKIDLYNKGLQFPTNYNDTYIATQHIQKYKLNVDDSILDKINDRLNSEDIFFPDKSKLEEIAVGLIKGNIILQGPPGTGKTTIAKIICNSFGVTSEIITATADWTTYDTIGGYQPEIENGNEVIVGKNGKIVDSVLECCDKVVQNEKNNTSEEIAHWLIIDELNRSEIDKVFGDLFTAFGSDDPEKRKISLWFHKDENKKLLYIPNRFRVIGVINNIDKNFVYNLSQGLIRRFTFINIYPPKIEKYDEEIDHLKNKILINSIPEKVEQLGEEKIDENRIKELLQIAEFEEAENKLKKFLKYVRYEDDNKKYLDLKIGTAQIIDIYETILINILLKDFEEKSDLIRVIDSALSSRIVPQMDGHDYELLTNFYQEHFEKNSEFSAYRETKMMIKNLL
ncbi:MAG: AAA family ATPase [archaeon]